MIGLVQKREDMATNNFFSKKQPWSAVKDKVVAGYLTPYCAKLLATNKPLKVVDCFAGKGRFDDGKDGSPLMIAKVIKDILKTENAYNNKNIEACFIEQKYHNDLKVNLQYYSQCRVISGKFEENILEILEKNDKDNINLFLYIDPYGIKSLSFKVFNRLKSMDKVSTEILMNFNSFGFLREGFRLLGKNIPKELNISNYEDDDKNTIERMNEIANGDYWQEIILNKNSGKINMYEAEELFIKEYMNQLKIVYNYVINIPIKEKRERLPKYRLIFGSNHPEGLFLMVDTMKKGWNHFLEASNEYSLFKEFELPDYNIGEVNLENEIIALIPSTKKIKLVDLWIKLVNKYGICFSIVEYREKLAILSGENKNSLGGLFSNDKINIIRNYETKSGRTPRDFDWKNEIYIERI